MMVFKRSDIPNILSVFRILLVPVFVYLLQGEGERGIAVLVFLAAGLTDVVDGFLARRFNWISNVGKLLDPLADKCMQIAALICLGQNGFIPWWAAGILVLKEFVLLVGALCTLKRKKVYLHSDWYGKAGTVAFYIIATLLVLIEDMSDEVRIMLGVLLIVFMLFALAMYIVNYKRNISHTNGNSESI